ncbi:MAG: hypothetical protein FJ138_05955 [Deltaproteobacteria bacterium]|nr:hypothetical protein [Deltaproteobacteria bacterium]
MSPEGGGAGGDPVEAWLLGELRAGRPVSFRALGGSMWPAARAGGRVTLEPAARPPRRGEVWVFVDPDAPEGARLSPLHRVVWVAGGRAWCKGDALARLDDPRPAAAALGRLCAVEGAGRLRAALAAPRGALGRFAGWALCVGQGGGRWALIGARLLLCVRKS